MLVEKFGVLRRPQSCRLTTKVVSECIKLHNLGVDNDVYMAMLITRDLRVRESLLHAQPDVVSLKPKYLKSRMKSSIRDTLCNVLKAQGFARPIANRKRVRGN
jgi:hypothetical protein